MVSRNKYAFCSEVWNFARLFSSKRDSAAESLAGLGGASVASGVPATPAAAAAVAPAWNNLRLENRSELIGPSCGAQPILPLRKAPGRRWVKKAGKLLCSEPALSTPMLIGRGFTLTHVSPPRTQSLNMTLPRKRKTHPCTSRTDEHPGAGTTRTYDRAAVPGPCVVALQTRSENRLRCRPEENPDA